MKVSTSKSAPVVFVHTRTPIHMHTKDRDRDRDRDRDMLTLSLTVQCCTWPLPLLSNTKFGKPISVEASPTVIFHLQRMLIQSFPKMLVLPHQHVFQSLDERNVLHFQETIVSVHSVIFKSEVLSLTLSNHLIWLSFLSFQCSYKVINNFILPNPRDTSTFSSISQFLFLASMLPFSFVVPCICLTASSLFQGWLFLYYPFSHVRIP